jgi:hypothetical protein
MKEIRPVFKKKFKEPLTVRLVVLCEKHSRLSSVFSYILILGLIWLRLRLAHTRARQIELLLRTTRASEGV